MVTKGSWLWMRGSTGKVTFPKEERYVPAVQLQKRGSQSLSSPIIICTDYRLWVLTSPVVRSYYTKSSQLVTSTFWDQCLRYIHVPSYLQLLLSDAHFTLSEDKLACYAFFGQLCSFDHYSLLILHQISYFFP